MMMERREGEKQRCDGFRLAGKRRRYCTYTLGTRKSLYVGVVLIPANLNDSSQFQHDEEETSNLCSFFWW